MNKYLENLVKKINGSLLGIGIDSKKIIDLIEKSKKILECNLLDCYMPDSTDIGKTKKISNKRLRKKFKKHHVDTIICNLDNILDFKERFIYDSIYIVKNDIYIFATINSEETIRRYKRYGSVNVVKYNDGFIYEIKITKKINKINEFYYKLIDSVIDIIDIISNIL